MIKTYTENISTVTSEAITVIGLAIFNNSESTDTSAIMYLKDKNENIRSQILDLALSPKETIFLDTKIFVGYGDTLVVEGAEFTMTGHYKNVV